GNALFPVQKDMDGIHPFTEIRRGILKNGVFKYREGVLTVSAMKLLWFFTAVINLTDTTAMTARHFTFTVSHLDKVFDNGLFSGKFFQEFKEIHSFKPLVPYQ
ncbi:MAG TPA: hypothetical protein VN132_13150, partial [Bdellovibrio sp.]|nr:hypothetical protein [Bdellovibrio sp.]